VNAYYNPVQNEIVFPAGILQSPFFDPDADDAVNYGAIGAIIGHEMTHGFDDEGSKYDGDGNLNDWWTAEDRKRFDALGELLVEQYGAQTVEGISVNGKLTLGENIADLGGILIAFDAYQAELARTGRTDKDGFTPEQRFFLTIGQNERDVKRPETAKTQVLNDPHAPAHLRVNCPLQHVPVFYDAFGVVPGDGMYRADELRAHIW
jgi:putative endopeptidase